MFVCRWSVRLTLAATFASALLACASRRALDVAVDSALVGPPLTAAPVHVDTAPRDRQLARRDTAGPRRFRDRNERDADVALGPVPGYAGVMMEGSCTVVVLLTDT